MSGVRTFFGCVFKGMESGEQLLNADPTRCTQLPITVRSERTKVDRSNAKARDQDPHFTRKPEFYRLSMRGFNVRCGPLTPSDAYSPIIPQYVRVFIKTHT
eukprot:841862-Prorocentrum_minimum.AAC.1